MITSRTSAESLIEASQGWTDVGTVRGGRAFPTSRSVELGGRRTARPGDRADKGEQATDQQVGDPGVVLADPGVREVHVEDAHAHDGEEDADHGANHEGEG